jgi:ABC-type multidrug transport system ATPase subunit
MLIKQRYRDKQVFVWVTLMPLLYVIGGFIAVKVITPPSTTAPSLTLNLEAVDNFASRFFSPVTPIEPSNTKNGITFTDSIPQSQTVPGLYTGNSEVPAYVGGVNVTNSAPLQFSTKYSYGVNVAQNAFAQTQTDFKITTVLVPLLTPGALPDANTDYDVGGMILPILVGMGFLPLSYGVLAVISLKEQNFVSVFRMIGVSRLQMYQGVILSSVCTSFVPFLLIVIILSLALGVSLFANGGRWLATLLALFGYGYAIIPFGLASIPIFPTLKAAQQWWPMIMLVLQIGPFIAYSIVVNGNADNADTARILVYAFGVLPPFAFQYVLYLYSSTEIVSKEWSEIWAWDTQLPYSLLMLYVMGTLLWLVVLFQVNHAPEWGTAGTLEPDVEVEDPDVDAERKRALQNSDGLNTRSTVRHFTVKEKYPPHVLLLYPYLWLLSLIRIFKFPELKTTTKKAVKGVSLGIKPGEILALLGPNGAGKSTLQNMVSRDLVPSGGSIAMAGVDRGEGEREGTYFQKIFAKGKLGYCTQNNFLFKKMSVIEHLNLFMELRGLDLEAHAPHLDAIIEMLRLGPHLQKPATKISGGQKRCVNAAMALIGYPELLQLDEISSGVDAEKRRMIWDILKPPAAGDYVGPAVLLCTHYMEEAIALGTRIAIMVDGEVITAGTLKRLKEKHCHANFLEVTFKEESWSHLNSEDNFMQALSDHGLEAEVTESLPGRLRVRLPIHDMSKNTLNLAKLFDTMESIFDQQGIEYYHIALQSLEQIFIELSKRQSEINEGTLKEEESEGGSPPKRLVRLASSAKVDDNTINAKVDDTV